MSELFDPNKFIDRDFECELFRGLLDESSTARILAIRDKGGMGKTQLLGRFQHYCRTSRPRVPVSLLALDRITDPTPLAVVKKVLKDLKDAFGLRFPRFDQYEVARVSGNFALISSSVYLQDANFANAHDTRIASHMANVEHADQVNVAGLSSLNPEQDAIAREVCVEAFLDDMRDHCQTTPIVLMLDAYEKCPEDVQTWIVRYLLERQFFDRATRPRKLILVMAGRELPRFDTYWSNDDIVANVESVGQLGKWTKEHVEECLRVYGFEHLLTLVDFFYWMIEEGHPPSQVVATMQMVAEVPA